MARYVNPLTEDPTLRKLLNDVSAILDELEFKRWKETFLTEFDRYLSQEGAVDANNAFRNFSTIVLALAKEVRRMEQFHQDGDTTSVQARQCIEKFADKVVEATDAMDALMPGTQKDEKRAGFTKFNLGAILVRDDFAEFDRLEKIQIHLGRLRKAGLEKNIDQETMNAIDNYGDAFDKLLDILADLGLFHVMQRCTTFVKGEWAPPPSPEQKKTSSSQDSATELEIRLDPSRLRAALDSPENSSESESDESDEDEAESTESRSNQKGRENPQTQNFDADGSRRSKSMGPSTRSADLEQSMRNDFIVNANPDWEGFKKSDEMFDETKLKFKPVDDAKKRYSMMLKRPDPVTSGSSPLNGRSKSVGPTPRRTVSMESMSPVRRKPPQRSTSIDGPPMQGRGSGTSKSGENKISLGSGRTEQARQTLVKDQKGSNQPTMKLVNGSRGRELGRAETTKPTIQSKGNKEGTGIDDRLDNSRSLRRNASTGTNENQNRPRNPSVRRDKSTEGNRMQEEMKDQSLNRLQTKEQGGGVQGRARGQSQNRPVRRNDSGDGKSSSDLLQNQPRGRSAQSRARPDPPKGQSTSSTISQSDSVDINGKSDPSRSQSRSRPTRPTAAQSSNGQARSRPSRRNESDNTSDSSGNRLRNSNNSRESKDETKQRTLNSSLLLRINPRDNNATVRQKKDVVAISKKQASGPTPWRQRMQQERQTQDKELTPNTPTQRRKSFGGVSTKSNDAISSFESDMDVSQQRRSLSENPTKNKPQRSRSMTPFRRSTEEGNGERVDAGRRRRGLSLGRIPSSDKATGSRQEDEPARGKRIMTPFRRRSAEQPSPEEDRKSTEKNEGRPATPGARRGRSRTPAPGQRREEPAKSGRESAPDKKPIAAMNVDEASPPIKSTKLARYSSSGVTDKSGTVTKKIEMEPKTDSGRRRKNLGNFFNKDGKKTKEKDNNPDIFSIEDSTPSSSDSKMYSKVAVEKASKKASPRANSSNSSLQSPSSIFRIKAEFKPPNRSMSLPLEAPDSPFHDPFFKDEEPNFVGVDESSSDDEDCSDDSSNGSGSEEDSSSGESESGDDFGDDSASDDSESDEMKTNNEKSAPPAKPVTRSFKAAPPNTPSSPARGSMPKRKAPQGKPDEDGFCPCCGQGWPGFDKWSNLLE